MSFEYVLPSGNDELQSLDGEARDNNTPASPEELRAYYDSTGECSTLSDLSVFEQPFLDSSHSAKTCLSNAQREDIDIQSSVRFLATFQTKVSLDYGD